MTNDCRNCNFNTYKDIDEPNWVSCSHPIALAKLPKWQPGDPALVNYRTGDLAISEIDYMADCPTWSPRSPQDRETP